MTVEVGAVEVKRHASLPYTLEELGEAAANKIGLISKDTGSHYRLGERFCKLLTGRKLEGIKLRKKTETFDVLNTEESVHAVLVEGGRASASNNDSSIDEESEDLTVEFDVIHVTGVVGIFDLDDLKVVKVDCIEAKDRCTANTAGWNLGVGRDGSKCFSASRRGK